MATVTMGDSSTFDSLIFGEPHPGTYNFLRNQLENISPVLNSAGQAFIEGGRYLFDKLYGEEAMRTLKAAKRAINGMWRPNEIRPLMTMFDYQSAPPIMRRFIMVNPYIRERFQEQTLSGYDGLYKDPFPKDKTEDHYDYQRVMNGILVETEELDYTATTYYNDPLYGDSDELDFLEKLDIIYTWDRIVNEIRFGKEDPTSLFGADL